MHFNPLLTVVRSIIAAFVAGALFFFTGNLLGIVALACYRAFTGQHPDFSLAYRAVGLPVGIIASAAALVAVWIYDVRLAKRAASH